MCYKELLLQVTGHQASKVESREGERKRRREKRKEDTTVTGLGMPLMMQVPFIVQVESNTSLPANLDSCSSLSLS